MMSLNLHWDANLVVPLGVSTVPSEAENRKSLRGNRCMCPSGIFTSFLAFQSLRGTRHKFQFKGCVLLIFRTGFLNSHLPRRWRFSFGLRVTDLNNQKPGLWQLVSMGVIRQHGQNVIGFVTELMKANV